MYEGTQVAVTMESPGDPINALSLESSTLFTSRSLAKLVVVGEVSFD